MAVEHPLPGVGHGQGLLGPGNGHVAQPPLLLQLLGAGCAAGRGEQALLQPYQKDMVEFQALGAVHGHHDHRLGAGVILLQIGIEGNFLQEPGQAGLVGVLQIAHQAGLELADVLQPVAALHVVLGLQHGLVAGALQELLIEVGQGHGIQQRGAVLNQIREGGELSGSLFQGAVAPGVGHHGIEANLFGIRQPGRRFQRLGADAPGRQIDDPPEPQIVAAVVDDAEIGQHVLDLGPVEEAHTADDAVGNAVSLEGSFQCVGLGVGPVQHGDIFKLPALGQAEDLGRHKAGLVGLGVGLPDADSAAGGVLGPERLSLPAPVMGDHGVGRLQNGLGGAVVLLQADHLGRRILLLKVENILDGRAPEPVDALVIVAHHAEVLIAPGQQRGQQVLEVVGVLVLVDQHIAELPLIVGPDLLVLLQQLHGQQDDIVEVQGVGLPQAALVLDVGVGGLLGAVIPRGSGDAGKFLRRLLPVLGPADEIEEEPGRKGLLVQIEVPNHVLHHPLGIGGVVDREAAGIAQPVDLPAENPAAGRVEGHGPDVGGSVAQHRRQTVLELVGGLIGEGNGQDGPGLGGLQGAERFRLGLVAAVPEIVLEEVHVGLGDKLGDLLAVRGPAKGHQIDDAVNEHGGLAAARTGQKQQRPLRRQRSPLLHLIE